MIGRLIGRFRVDSQLGSGGMASVWKAEDTLLKRQVALKILSDDLSRSPQAQRRFLHEARNNARLHHPGVPAVFDYGEQDGFTYIAMAMIDGETLSALAARAPMSVAEAVRVVRDAAGVLAHAHDLGITHRDVTGRNVMIARDGRVFVLDFGLALAAGDSRVTSSDTVLGTVAYMAPEVLSGCAADHRRDIYGLGVVLFEALTGRLPFEDRSGEPAYLAALHTDPPSPRIHRPDVPGEIEHVVLKAMSRDPDGRFATAAEMTAALTALMGSARDELRPEAPVPIAADRSAVTSRETTSVRMPAVIGVLPFEFASAGAERDEALEAITRSLTVSLAGGLASVKGIQVAAPAAPNVASEDPQDTARRLDCNLLLSGAVRRAGYELRVTWTLTDPWRRHHVASNTVQGNDSELFALEDRLLQSLRSALGVDGAEPVGPSGPRDPAAEQRYQQALGYLKRTDNEASVEGAISLLERLLASEGETAPVQARLARAYLSKYLLSPNREWETKAAQACDRAQRLAPDDPDVLVALGELHLGAGRAAEAGVEFQRALEQRPGWADAMLGLARAEDAADHPDHAETIYREAIGRNPADWRLFSQLGQLSFRHGKYAEAREAFGRVVSLTPDNARAHANLGVTLCQLERFEESLAAFRRSIEIQPTARTLTGMGTLLYYMRRFADAAEAFEHAIALSPSDPQLWGELGSAFRQIPGREARSTEALDRAIAMMRERLERNPEDASGWASLSAWLTNRNRQPEAIEAIERALALAPENVVCMRRAGEIYLYFGDRQKAIHWFHQAVRRGYSVELLKREPELEPLMSDPEFVRVLEARSGRDDA